MDAEPVQLTLSDSTLQAAMGDSISGLLDAIAQAAEERNLPLYLVGGVVRDVLLRRQTFDLDFVIETRTFGEDAYTLAETLAMRYGGSAEQHAAFGTAKWKTEWRYSDEHSTSRPEAFWDAIDFVSARTETYVHPGALPSVAPGTLEQDLARRDFTINTLALQLAPTEARGRLIDLFGGLGDLDAGLIRVLHPASFRDDPTRILRGARLATRFAFTIEPSTLALIAPALPALANTTGERLRNDLTRVFDETAPERPLRLLESLGVLNAIHPAFLLSPSLEHDFEIARTPGIFVPLMLDGINRALLLWHLIAAHLAPNDTAAWAKRLLFDSRLSASLARVSVLHHEQWAGWNDSAILKRLDAISDEALCALYLLKPDSQPLLIAFATRWREFRLYTDGAALQAHGLRPGPCYRVILDHLRRAWIDGEITAEGEEYALLARLIADGICAE